MHQNSEQTHADAGPRHRGRIGGVIKPWCLTALICWLPLLASATEAYKWVDKDGNVHFSDRPPEEVEASLEAVELKVDIPPQRQADGQSVLDASQSSLDERRTATSEADQRRLRRQAEAEQAAAQRQAMCHLARSNLQVLQEQRPVYTFDDKGERVYVEDEDRQGRIEAYQRAVAEHCR